MTGFLGHCRVALRTLTRSPAFALTGVVTLAVASATLTSILAVIGQVLVRPLPLVDEDRIVLAWKRDLDSGFEHWPFAYTAVRALQPQLETVSDVATVDYNGAYPLSVVDGDRGIKLPTGIISGNLMPLLGIRPTLGRILLATDDVAGAERVAVISAEFWRARYGGDPDVLGRTVRIYDFLYQIVGVVPGTFGLPANAAMWIAPRPFQGDLLDRDDAFLADLVVRLKPGRTLAEFRVELEAARQRTTIETIPAYKANRVVAKPLREVVVGEVRPTLLLLGAGASLVLLVACVNLGSLLLVRSGGRLHEIAVRAAVGGRGLRSLRAVLFEYGMVVATGAALGIPAGWVMLRLLLPTLPADLPGTAGVGLDATTVLVALAICLAAGALAGVAPIATLARVNLVAALYAGGRAVSGWGTHPLRRGMVALQLAVAVMVVASAGLLLRTLERLQRIDVGFRPKGVLFLKLADSRSPADTAGVRDRINRVVDHLSSVRGVTSATAVLSPPFVGNAGFYMKLAPKEVADTMAAAIPFSNVEVVLPTAIETLGLRLRRGRFLEPADRQGSPGVIVINEELAHTLWPGEDPIGRRARIVGGPADYAVTVVGVVADTRYNELRRAMPMVYFSYRQMDWFPGNYAVRHRDEAALGPIVAELRRVVREVDPNLVLESATPLTALLDEPLARPRLAAVLVAGFGLIVLGLAAIGIYVVVASFVVHRTREIGVRMALGANGRMVHGLVFRQGMVVTTIGVAAGLVLAGVATRLLEGFLYEISPLDGVTFASAALVLLLVAALAILVPAVKASRLNPVIALKAD